MSAPEARLSQFLKYAAGRPQARARTIQEVLDGEYGVEKDFYKRIREAVGADRRGARDGTAVALAAQNATEKKATRFAELARQWPKVIGRWADCTPVNVRPVHISIAGLDLTVKAAFAERFPDGTLEIVHVLYAVDPGYTRNDLDMVLRLIQRAYGPRYAEVRIAVVHLPTARTRTTDGQDLSRHDLRIDTDAAGMAWALRNAA